MTHQERYEQIPDPHNYLHEVGFRAGLDRLGKEAKEVVSLILTCPGELADWTIEHADITQASIRMYMKSYGWSPGKVNRAFSQIKRMLMAVDGL